MPRTAIISDKTITMHLVRRALVPPIPGMAEARHEYTTIFTTKAAVRTMSGTTEWNTIVVDGKQVSHVWTMRFTRIPFDSRDRIRDAEGNLYQVMKVENPNNANRELKIYTAKVGQEGIAANQ
jgi:hypothetical protein